LRSRREETQSCVVLHARRKLPALPLSRSRLSRAPEAEAELGPEPVPEAEKLRGRPPPARCGEEERVAGEGGRAEERAHLRGGRRAELGGEGGQGARPAWIRPPARRSGRLLVGSARRAELEVERREGVLDPPEGERRERRPAS